MCQPPVESTLNEDFEKVVVGKDLRFGPERKKTLCSQATRSHTFRIGREGTSRRFGQFHPSTDFMETDHLSISMFSFLLLRLHLAAFP